MGHHSMLTVDKLNPELCLKVLTRGIFTNYVLFPTKFSFSMMVRIHSICLKFVRSFCQIWEKKKLELSIPVTTARSATPHRIPLTMQLSAHASFYSSDHKEPKRNFSSLTANVHMSGLIIQKYS